MDSTRHAAEVVAQTELLATDLAGTDLRTPVPSRPGWTLGMLPRHLDRDPAKRDLLGPGRTPALAATDADGRWFVDLTGEVITSRRGPGAAAVTARGSPADLLLLVHRREPLPGNGIADSGITVDGEAALLDFWLEHVAFG